jgi:hypothetical protein
MNLTKNQTIITKALNAQLAELNAQGKDFKALDNTEEHPDNSWSVNCSDVFAEKTAEIIASLKDSDQYIELADERVVIHVSQATEWLNEETGELKMLKPSLILSEKRTSIVIDADFD